MKNKLTDFQADWAAMPQVEKEQILKLKNKTIVVSGHSLARCLCYALIYQNETRNLGCKVVLCAQDKSLIDDLYPELILREDFDFVDFNSVSEINKADFIVHTGFCNEAVSDFTADFRREIKLAQVISALAQKTNAPLLKTNMRTSLTQTRQTLKISFSEPLKLCSAVKKKHADLN